MEVETYTVYFEGARLVAKDMVLEDALLLADALFHKYYNESNMVIRIERQFRPMTHEEFEE